MKSIRLGSKARSVEDERKPTEVFAELYEQYLPKVFHYVSYRVGDADMAEDLTSIVFEKALTQLDSYHADRASFATWLFSIARNAVIDYYRARSRRSTVALERASEAVVIESSAEEKAIRGEEEQRLRMLVARLPEREQEIISLKFGAELTNRQIASILKLSESNVGTILYRAILRLRGSLEEMANGRA